jgi:ubiquinone/menaquinone biosynthesis C-methylase UbiE
MADPYSDLGAQDTALQQRIADAMEARCQEPAQIAIRKAYLQNLGLAEGARALELGSGTGHVTRDLLDIAGAATAHGIDPSPVMVARARDRFGTDDRLSFDIGDARNTGFEDEAFDLVVMHTLLCHVPGPENVVREAFRILKPGGVLAVCDGDYSTATARIADFDPLDQLIQFMICQNATNLWIMRQISGILGDVGFRLGARTGHGYVAEGEAAYFLTVVDRAADRMVEDGILFAETAAALKAEARSRVAANTFFGFISYVSQIARKP